MVPKKEVTKVVKLDEPLRLDPYRDDYTCEVKLSTYMNDKGEFKERTKFVLKLIEDNESATPTSCITERPPQCVHIPKFLKRT